jgi:hypothetical protein
MYKDDQWYQAWAEAVEIHQEEFTPKQNRRYQIDLMTRIARRVRDHSERCERCRSYQHTLTRLEEEMQELPDSKAQRQWQRQKLREIGQHYVAQHNLAPPGYYTRQGLKYGLLSGAALGVLVGLIVLGIARRWSDHCVLAAGWVRWKN